MTHVIVQQVVRRSSIGQLPGPKIVRGVPEPAVKSCGGNAVVANVKTDSSSG